MILNLLVLAAVAVVAVFGALQRLYHAAMALAALVLAGGLAVVLGGPVSSVLFGAAGDIDSTWHYVGDALCLWVVLCVGFLGLRTAGHRWLPGEAPVPKVAQVAGGAVFGALTGYLAVGLALVTVQMLPVAPSFLGYTPFRYIKGTSRENPERVVRHDMLWLAPDRAAVWLLDLSTGGGTRDEGGALLDAVGDAYPPEAQRPQDYKPSVDTDDFLYALWYRRWQAIRWRTGAAGGPLASIPPDQVAREALPLQGRQPNVIHSMKLEVRFTARTNRLPGIANLLPPEGHEFLQVRVCLEPENRLPRIIDSAQFVLVDESGQTVAENPLVYGEALRRSAGDEKPKAIGLGSGPPVVPRNLRFAFPESGERGVCVADGMRFPFTEKGQYETRTFIFAVPTHVSREGVRLFMHPRFPSAAEIEKMPSPTRTKPPDAPTPEPRQPGGDKPADLHQSKGV